MNQKTAVDDVSPFPSEYIYEKQKHPHNRQMGRSSKS
jgi:hypothetical protein